MKANRTAMMLGLFSALLGQGLPSFGDPPPRRSFGSRWSKFRKGKTQSLTALKRRKAKKKAYNKARAVHARIRRKLR